MPTTLNFYGDPGHGWLKVPYTLLVTLGIEDGISTCSYMKKFTRGWFVYLEEDCDAELVIDSFRCQLEGHVMIPERLILKYHHTDKSSRIRNYQRYDNLIIQKSSITFKSLEEFKVKRDKLV